LFFFCCFGVVLLAVLLLGIRQAKRPATPDYPLGYGKEIYSGPSWSR
jgi:divalent metal cation (Fe/Co/Zn/Cd) transporter